MMKKLRITNVYYFSYLQLSCCMKQELRYVFPSLPQTGSREGGHTRPHPVHWNRDRQRETGTLHKKRGFKKIGIYGD
jgi:hypothetical protein